MIYHGKDTEQEEQQPPEMFDDLGAQAINEGGSPGLAAKS